MKMQGAGVAAVAAAGNQGEEKKTVNPELWHACAGPLVSIPPAGSLVVYFPQGHSEQVAASMRKDIDAHIPNYPNLPSEMICLLHNVTLHADPETDEVYAQMTLQPVNTTNKEAILASDLSLKSNKPQPEFFCKTLTASDTSTHGGFSVPRRSAEKIFPPLDYGMQPPAQELQARDLHDNVWTFRHIYRGQPKRHLLTTGWSLFVSGKRLLAGDSVLFIRDEKSQLLLGIRRANRQPTNIPSSVLSSDSMHIGILAAAAHAAANNSPFTVFYNPRTSPSEFVIPLAKYNKAIYGNHISVGMRFRMMFETEESGTRRYMGTITGISDLDPVRWKNSRWRNLQVGWDESAAGERRNRVSIWEIEPVLAPFFIYPPFFGSKRSRQPDDESQEMENLLKRVVPWLGEDVTIKDPLCQSGVMPGLSLVQWMNLQQSSLLANSNMQSLSGAGLQNLSAADLSRQLSLQAQALQKSNIQFNPQRPPQQAQQLEQLSKLAPQLKQLGGFPVSQEQLQDISMQRQTMVNQTGTYNQTQTPLSQTQIINPQMQQQQHASLVQTHQFPQSNVLPSHSQQITLQQQHQHQITLQQQHQQQMTLQQQHQQQMTLQQQQQQHQQQITLQQQQQQQHQQQITLQQQQQQHQQQITLQQQQQQLLQQQLLQQQKQLQANVPLQIPNQINQQLQMSEQQAQLQLLKKFQEQQKALQQEQSILCQPVLQHPQPTQEQRSKVLESSNHFANSNLHVQQNITKNSPVGVQFPSVQNQVQQKSQQAQVMTTELPNPGFQNPQINPLQRIGSCLPTSGARSVITDDIPSCSTSPSTNNGSSIPHKTANKIHSSLPCTDTMQLCTLTTGSTGNVETQIGNVKTTQELQKPASLVKPSVPIPKSQHTGTVAPQAYLGSGTQVDYLDSSSSATSNCISHSDVQLQQPIQYSSFNEQPIPFRDSSADVGIQTTDQRNNQFLFGVNIDDQLCVPMTSDHLLDKNIGQGKDCLNTITPGNMIENYNSKEVQQEISSSFVSQPFGVADVPFNSIESTVDDTSFLNKCSWAPPPQVQRMRTYTKVYKRGAVGRSIDIARYSGYDELKQDLIRMFSIGGQIEDLQRLGWKLVYVDHENDVLLVGDDPWEEFVGCVRSIKILSPQEVQQMSLDGDIGGNNSLPNQTCSSSDGGNVWRGQCDQNLGNTSTASYDHFH